MESLQDIKVLKIGIRQRSPGPALTLLYITEGQKRYRIMPVLFLPKTGPVDIILKTLREHHDILESVSDMRIEKMLKILQLTASGKNVQKAAGEINTQYKIDPNQDLNKVSETELERTKKLMDDKFEKNQVKKGDKNFKYDFRIDYETEEPITAGWDNEKNDDEDFWE